jgi:hypothetical protein
MELVFKALNAPAVRIVIRMVSLIVGAALVFVSANGS